VLKQKQTPNKRILYERGRPREERSRANKGAPKAKTSPEKPVQFEVAPSVTFPHHVLPPPMARPNTCLIWAIGWQARKSEGVRSHTARSVVRTFSEVGKHRTQN